MEILIDGWNQYMLPLIPNSTQQFAGKHRSSISASIILLALYLGYEKLTRAPKKLRHFPQASYWKVIQAQLTKTPTDDFYTNYVLPVANQADHGMYTRFDRDGWSIRITRPEAAKKLLLKASIFEKADLENEIRDTMNQRFIIGPNVLFLNGEAWKHQRVIASPAFHRSMPVNLFGNLTLKLFENMDLKDGSVDFRDMMERFTLDAIGSAGFGFDFNSLADRNSDWVRTYESVMRAIQNPMFLFFPILDTKLRFLFPARQRSHQELTRFKSMISDIIQSKRQTLKESQTSGVKDNEKDLLTLMIEAGNEDSKGLTDEQLLSNICVFFLAGHDTTANALSFAAYYLATHKDVQMKAREEAIRILGEEPKDVLPTLDQIKDMSYITMVIKEVLRIKGPISALISRNVTEDTELAGVFIPKNTRINLDIYALHHNPAVWNDPEAFNPERFAPGGEAESLGLSWLPFGSGARQCLGMNFSLAEQRVLLSMLLKRYEFSLPKDSIHKEKVKLKHYGILTPKELYIDFKKRY